MYYFLERSGQNRKVIIISICYFILSALLSRILKSFSITKLFISLKVGNNLKENDRWISWEDSTQNGYVFTEYT